MLLRISSPKSKAQGGPRPQGVLKIRQETEAELLTLSPEEMLQITQEPGRGGWRLFSPWQYDAILDLNNISWQYSPNNKDTMQRYFHMAIRYLVSQHGQDLFDQTGL